MMCSISLLFCTALGAIALSTATASSSSASSDIRDEWDTYFQDLENPPPCDSSVYTAPATLQNYSVPVPKENDTLTGISCGSSPETACPTIAESIKQAAKVNVTANLCIVLIAHPKSLCQVRLGDRYLVLDFPRVRTLTLKGMPELHGCPYAVLGQLEPPGLQEQFYFSVKCPTFVFGIHFVSLHRRVLSPILQCLTPVFIIHKCKFLSGGKAISTHIRGTGALFLIESCEFQGTRSEDYPHSSGRTVAIRLTGHSAQIIIMKSTFADLSLSAVYFVDYVGRSDLHIADNTFKNLSISKDPVVSLHLHVLLVYGTPAEKIAKIVVEGNQFLDCISNPMAALYVDGQQLSKFSFNRNYLHLHSSSTGLKIQFYFLPDKWPPSNNTFTHLDIRQCHFKHQAASSSDPVTFIEIESNRSYIGKLPEPVKLPSAFMTISDTVFEGAPGDVKVRTTGISVEFLGANVFSYWSPDLWRPVSFVDAVSARVVLSGKLYLCGAVGQGINLFGDDWTLADRAIVVAKASNVIIGQRTDSCASSGFACRNVSDRDVLLQGPGGYSMWTFRDEMRSSEATQARSCISCIRCQGQAYLRRDWCSAASTTLDYSVIVQETYLLKRFCPQSAGIKKEAFYVKKTYSQFKLANPLQCLERAESAWILGPGPANSSANSDSGTGNRSCDLYREWMNHGNESYADRNRMAEAATVANLTTHVLCRLSSYSVLVLNQFNLLQPLVRSWPAWILFNAATTGCYKEHNGFVYLLPTMCAGPNYSSPLLPEWTKGLQSHGAFSHLIKTLASRRGAISNIVIGTKFAVLPWSHAAGPAWNVAGCSRDDRNSSVVSDCLATLEETKMLGSLTLYPAPGEVIQLNLATLDVGLGRVSATVNVKVESEDARLLQVDKPENSYTEIRQASFLSDSWLRAIALGGYPGATGHFVFTVTDRTSTRGSQGQPLSLKVPFRLRPCFLGYHMALNDSQTDQGEPESLPWTKRICNCSDSIPAISQCGTGQVVMINRGFWAGNIQEPDAAEETVNWKGMSYSRIPMTSSFTVNETLYRSRHVTGVFGAAQCINGLCQPKTWYLQNDLPCLRNATGPLCGQCKDKYFHTLASTGCTPYSSREIHLAVYVLVVVVLTCLSFALMLYFNMGLSPLLDSWLFFVQACWYLYRNDVPFIHSTIHTALTFGLGHLRITPDLGRMGSDTLLLLQPMLFLFLFIVLRWALSHSCSGRILQRQQKHMRLVRVMWFVLVCSYFQLAMITINLLTCVPIAPKRRVWGLDGSVGCFSNQHLPFAVPALFILLVVIVPPPLLLIWPRARQMHGLMSFIDQACHLYKDNRRWWAAVNLMKRVCLAVICSQVAQEFFRLLTITIFFWCLLLAHFFAWPLREKTFLKLSHGVWEFLFLFLLQAISSLHLAISWYGTSYAAPLRPAMLVLYIFPTAFLCLACLCRQCFSARGGYGRLRNFSLMKLWKQHFGPPKDEDMLNTIAMENMARGIQVPFLMEASRLHGRRGRRWMRR